MPNTGNVDRQPGDVTIPRERLRAWWRVRLQGSRGMARNLMTAVALMLVLEGLLPFLVPRIWREMFRRLTEMSDGQIRFFALTCMVAGVLLLFLMRLD
jgi:uncharacterized protein YjeT (DUF2065 family)